MKNRELTFKPELDGIIAKCQYCCLAMTDAEGHPYVLPMNFGFDGEYVYFHGSRTGKKVDALKKNPEVCINFSTDHDLRYVNEEVACSWSMRYRSVLVYGKAEFIEDDEEKIRCLNVIMKQYSDKNFEYSGPAVRDVMVVRVRVERMEGRAYGY
jgi:hypothetical protein